jgi:hypothetical protein
MNNYEVNFTLTFSNTEWIEADSPEEAQEDLKAIIQWSYKVKFADELLDFDEITITSVEESDEEVDED